MLQDFVTALRTKKFLLKDAANNSPEDLLLVLEYLVELTGSCTDIYDNDVRWLILHSNLDEALFQIGDFKKVVWIKGKSYIRVT